MKVLIVDDDHLLLELLEFSMRRAALEPVIAADVPTALRLFDSERPQLVILDVNLGSRSGFDLLQELRRRSDVPVIMLTAHTSEEDKVRGLELGADDYITKPFGHRELIARVRTQLRRADRDASAGDAETRVLTVGPLEINVAEYSASRNGRKLDLTATEFRLLQALMEEPATVVPTRKLLRKVWGYDDPAGGDVVRVAVHRLRRKIEDDPAAPTLIHTVPGVGVMVKAPEAPPSERRSGDRRSHL